MLRRPGLICSTAQIKVKWLESLVEVSVSSFWAAFAIEASLLCVWKSLLVVRSFIACRLDSLLLLPHASQFVLPVLSSIHVSVCS
jgi:hypothetical protein